MSDFYESSSFFTSLNTALASYSGVAATESEQPSGVVN